MNPTQLLPFIIVLNNYSMHLEFSYKCTRINDDYSVCYDKIINDSQINKCTCKLTTAVDIHDFFYRLYVSGNETVPCIGEEREYVLNPVQDIKWCTESGSYLCAYTDYSIKLSTKYENNTKFFRVTMNGLECDTASRHLFESLVINYSDICAGSYKLNYTNVYVYNVTSVHDNIVSEVDNTPVDQSTSIIPFIISKNKRNIKNFDCVRVARYRACIRSDIKQQLDQYQQIILQKCKSKLTNVFQIHNLYNNILKIGSNFKINDDHYVVDYGDYILYKKHKKTLTLESSGTLSLHNERFSTTHIYRLDITLCEYYAFPRENMLKLLDIITDKVLLKDLEHIIRDVGGESEIEDVDMCDMGNNCFVNADGSKLAVVNNTIIYNKNNETIQIPSRCYYNNVREINNVIRLIKNNQLKFIGDDVHIMFNNSGAFNHIYYDKFNTRLIKVPGRECSLIKNLRDEQHLTQILTAIEPHDYDALLGRVVKIYNIRHIFRNPIKYKLNHIQHSFCGSPTDITTTVTTTAIPTTVVTTTVTTTVIPTTTLTPTTVITTTEEPTTTLTLTTTDEPTTTVITTVITTTVVTEVITDSQFELELNVVHTCTWCNNTLVTIYIHTPISLIFTCITIAVGLVLAIIGVAVYIIRH